MTFKQLVYTIGGGVVGVVTLVGLVSDGGGNTVVVPTQPAVIQQTAPASSSAPKVVQPSSQTDSKVELKEAETTQLSNDNYYTNVDGNKVHSPAYSDSVPAGASARCRDGTYSFSQNRRGTCSHHGGVASWL